MAYSGFLGASVGAGGILEATGFVGSPSCLFSVRSSDGPTSGSYDVPGWIGCGPGAGVFRIGGRWTHAMKLNAVARVIAVRMSGFINHLPLTGLRRRAQC